MKNKIVVLIYLFASVYIFFNRQEYKQNPLHADASGYYLYLPAIFIYHDIEKLGFYPEVSKLYHLNDSYIMYGLTDQPGGKKLDRYAIGTSVFELPAFFIARLYCNIDHTYPDDGYSLPFCIADYLGCILWVAVGLYILSLFLKRYFSDGVVAFTILCIAFGTNLYYYSVFNPASSHPYSFVAMSCVLYFTDSWFRNFKIKYIVGLGVFLGLTIITRPVNIVISVIPFLWQVYDLASLKNRIRLLLRYKLHVIFALFIFMIIAFMQMLYWKTTTGHWIYYSYEGEYFNFLKPRIWEGLFSYRKGWFVYTPLALLSFIGFFFLWKKNKALVIAPVLFFVCIIYIDFSWTQWWYGSGFGCRELIDALPVAALPLCAFIEYVLSLRNLTLKAERLAIIFFFIVLNLFQTYQFSLTYIPYERMTSDYYWLIFGKTRFNPDLYNSYLIRNEDYFKDTN